MSFAASNNKNNDELEESTPEMRSVSIMSSSQSQTPRFSALPPLKSSSLSSSSFPSPLSKSTFPSPLKKSTLPPPLKKSTFSSSSAPLLKTSSNNNNSLEWKTTTIPTLPEYYHLGRSCTTVSNCENVQIITSKITDFLNKQSLTVTFEENIATCITSCQTKFLIKIFKEGEQQFIVEVQRLNGCSYVCQKYCRAILRTAMESCQQQEQEQSSSSSSPLRIIKSYEFRSVPASVIAQAEHDKEEKESKKGPIHQQNEDNDDDDEDAVSNLSTPSFRSTALKFPSPLKKNTITISNEPSSLPSSLNKNVNKKQPVQRSHSDSQFLKSRSAMMRAASTLQSKSTMSLPAVLPEFQPNDELREFKVILDQLKEFKLKYAEAQTEVDHLRNENQRIMQEYEEMKAKLQKQSQK